MKNNTRRNILWLTLSLLFLPLSAQTQLTLHSPNNKVHTEISIGEQITFSVSHENDLLLAPSSISMTLTDGKQLGINASLKKKKSNAVDQTITSPLYKRSVIKEQYNELTLSFKGNYDILFRAYDDGVAYRFVYHTKKPFKVKEEEALFRFTADHTAYIPYVKPRKSERLEDLFLSSFENTYAHHPLSQWEAQRNAFLPLAIEADNGKKIVITEADLLNYPGMFLTHDKASNGLKALFAPYPKKITQGGHNNLQGLIEEYDTFLAQYKRGTAFPWRVLVVSEKDADLADNDMVYMLSTPCQIADISWIKPGKVAWEWWNDWNLRGVPFKAGINNETYKYYMDFASNNGIEYIILDEGWAVNLQADLLQVVPEIDLQELTAYGKSKNVGIILWAGYYAFNRDIEGLCRHYSDMGIKGFKVDFMDRDDQEMVDFHHRAAAIAAKHHLLLDYHGTYKPTGLQRTYPNVINVEGVHGLETMKWSDPMVDQVTYDVTIPFIRMVAGPMDYTQGAMRNATKKSYVPLYSEPMSQGTRCRQLAQYVIFEAPLTMLCDNPSNYLQEQECTSFIAGIPTIWDDTRVLNGEIAQYITIARKRGEEWYVGAMTNWDGRAEELDLSFLGEGNYRAELFRDGVNADRAPSDYLKEEVAIPADRKVTIPMAPGGGYVMRIYRQ